MSEPRSSLRLREVATHFREQGPVIGAMVKAAAGGLLPSRGAGAAPGTAGATALLGHRFHGVAKLPSPALVADFRRFLGATSEELAATPPATVPAHLFPQWTFPLSARVLARTGLPLQRILNAGCSLRVLAPLTNEAPIDLAVELSKVDDDGRRLRLTQTLTMGRGKSPSAIAELSTYLPLSKTKGPRGEKARDPLVVPADGRSIDRWVLRRDAGRAFAALTGDVNPIHLSPLVARLSGFRGCILHGFATFARTFEALSRALAAEGAELVFLDLRFVKPLVLPATVEVFVGPDNQVAVGPAAGEGAFALGHFEQRAAVPAPR
jgi:acyl dehydratase